MTMVNLPTAGVDYHAPFGGRKASNLGAARAGTLCGRVLYDGEDGLYDGLKAARRLRGDVRHMILVSGEALIDLIPDPVKASAYDVVLGGSPYNVAIGLARLGAQTAFVSRISADGNGEALAASLAENGVDLSFVARDMRPTTLAFVMRGTAKTGSRYSFYLDATAFDGPWPFPAEWPKGGAPLACRLDRRRRPAPRTIRRPRR